MEPENEVNTEENLSAEVTRLVARIQQHQAATGLSDAKFCARYGRWIGSAKQWRERFCKGNYQDFGAQLATHKKKLQAMVGELDGRSQIDEYFEDMPFPRALTGIYERLQGQLTDRRCGVALAITGTGKSSWARMMTNKNPRDTVYIRANETWRDSQGSIIRGVAEGLGLQHRELQSTAACLGKVVEHLKANPMTMILDEAQCGGTALLKLVKTLIDETSCKFMLLAYPGLWNRMLAATDDSRAEALQLFGRTLKPVFQDYVNGIRACDIVAYLQAGTQIGSEADEVARQILAMVRGNGNLRLLADAVDMAKIQSDATGEKLTGELIVQQVRSLCPASSKGGETR